MRYLYYPATAASAFLYSLRKPPPLPLNWTDPRLPERHSAVLLSYYYWGREVLRLRDEGCAVFGDSGGWTIYTQGANIDPIDVLRWQMHSTTVGAILDIPPEGGPEWYECLAKTEANVKRALPVYREYNLSGPFRWWGVIQGESLSQMEQWYDRIASVYPFEEEGEGWAFKPHPANDPRAVARCLSFAQRKGLKRIHLLMVTNIKGLVTLFTLGPRTDIEFVSFDSSTATANAYRFRRLIVPEGDDYRIIEERYNVDGRTPAEDYMREECDCISCALFRQEYPERAPRVGAYIAARMDFHNVLALNRLFDGLRERAVGESYLRERLGKLYGPTLRAFEGREAHSVPVGVPRSLLDMI